MTYKDAALLAIGPMFMAGSLMFWVWRFKGHDEGFQEGRAICQVSLEMLREELGERMEVLGSARRMLDSCNTNFNTLVNVCRRGP